MSALSGPSLRLCGAGVAVGSSVSEALSFPRLGGWVCTSLTRMSHQDVLPRSPSVGGSHHPPDGGRCTILLARRGGGGTRTPRGGVLVFYGFYVCWSVTFVGDDAGSFHGTCWCGWSSAFMGHRERVDGWVEVLVVSGYCMPIN